MSETRKRIVHNDPDKCVGCNRCVRVCPIDEANITTLERDRIVVRIDNSKCIVCGACQVACHHGSRYFKDDIEEFLGDLKNGEPISVMIAPALRTNFPKWRQFITWLKNLGAEKIYDVSLGADICTWGHVRYFEKHGLSPTISQPCPAIVNYILQHRNDLTPYLSKVHSPMLCTAIYMTKYENIGTKIAAISPCAAKRNEFDRTGIVSYSVTFKQLQDYIEKNNIELPSVETEFDNIHAGLDAGLGTLYPMPGGLRECIEHYVGKTLRVDKSEGPTHVYRALDKFASKSDNERPILFDVLNCPNGCNLGTGCLRTHDVFDDNAVMGGLRESALGNKDGRAHLDKLFKTFDKKFALEDFLCGYVPTPVKRIPITDDDIEHAFASLGKFDALSRKFDCGACGSFTCLEMVQKIAKGLNIRHNCTEFSHRELKREHESVMAGLDYAAKIQGNLLPKSHTLADGFSDFSVIWKPRDIVGGDIYWMKSFDDGVVLCVCDCTGHGTPGALLTMLVVSALEAEVNASNCRDTANIIWQLEQRLIGVFGVESEPDRAEIRDGCDLAAMFVAKDGSATLSAGNTRVFVCDGVDVKQYKGQKIYVGEGRIKSKDDIKIVHIDADPNNKFYIASDGLFDQPGGANSLPYGYREFKEIILTNHHERQSIISGMVWDAFEHYRGIEARVDDFVLITFKP